jgi:hypothetical protein
MPLATARWLASKEGWSRHPSPSPAALEAPGVAAYFALGLLATRFRHGGKRRGERFAVMAFHAGPEAAAAFLRRRRQLRRARARRGGAGGDAFGRGWGREGARGQGWDKEEEWNEPTDGEDEGEEEEGEEEEENEEEDEHGCGVAPDIVAASRDADPRCDGHPGDQLRPRAPRTGWDDGGLASNEELSGLWRRYARAKGLVQRMAAALELRRRPAAGQGDWEGGSGGCLMHLVHQGETLKRIAAITGISGGCTCQGAMACGVFQCRNRAVALRGGPQLKGQESTNRSTVPLPPPSAPAPSFGPPRGQP